MSEGPAMTRTVATASRRDTLATVAEVLAPTVIKGVIIRRPRAMALAERLDADRRALRRLARLRATYGRGPLLLDLPGRRLALLLDGPDVRRVLAETPEPFATATWEKVAALRHFQPHGVLVSHGTSRRDRRQYNDDVLGSADAVHELSAHVLAKVAEETHHLVASVRATGRMSWADYRDTWWQLVRRVVLGDAARDDSAVTDDLAALRAAANFAFLHPGRPRLRRRFFSRLEGHLDRAEPGSLAGLMARVPTPPGTRPAEQVPQWLFAFDAAAWASYRTLALLRTHPEAAARVDAELAGRPTPAHADLEYLRACVLESVRLWPTTPLVLRETTRVTRWPNGQLPTGTGVLVFAPYFHRDSTHVVNADGFAPERWLGTTGGPELGDLGAEDWPLVPFSAGPAVCPGRNLVLLVTSAVLATLLAELELDLESPGRLDPHTALPGTLDPFHLTFTMRSAGHAA